MKYIEEIDHDYEKVGHHLIVKKSAIDKFVEWQKKNKSKDFKVVSVQKTDKGLFVVYEK